MKYIIKDVYKIKDKKEREKKIVMIIINQIKKSQSK